MGAVAPTLELVASIGIATELKAVAGSGGVTVENLQWRSFITQQTSSMHPTETRVVSW